MLMRTPMLLLPPKMKDHSDVIEAIDMVGMDFFEVTRMTIMKI